MSASFDRAFTAVIGAEGGYTNDRNDPGNWTGGRVGAGLLRGTKFGISAASFPTLDIANLTIDQAKAIYAYDYWAPIGCESLDPDVALVLFDCAVNQGVRAAATILQASVGVAQDGWVGPVTLAAANATPVRDLLVEVCARRALRYAAGDTAHYGLGWFRRLFSMAATALA